MSQPVDKNAQMEKKDCETQQDLQQKQVLNYHYYGGTRLCSLQHKCSLKPGSATCMIYVLMLSPLI